LWRRQIVAWYYESHFVAVFFCQFELGEPRREVKRAVKFVTTETVKSLLNFWYSVWVWDGVVIPWG
jgi:hypothetical protein